MLAKTNPRRCGRIYVQMPIKIVVESEGSRAFHDAATVDFSPLGCRVRANTDFPPGADIALLLGKKPSQPRHSRVIWASRANPAHMCEAGLEFSQPFDMGA
ncbi:MAG: PilZ domain-containing protein [Terriglobia bacterium]